MKILRQLNANTPLTVSRRWKTGRRISEIGKIEVMIERFDGVFLISVIENSNWFVWHFIRLIFRKVEPI